MTRESNLLGTALRLIREESHKFAKDVAQSAGISASYLSELERGLRRVTPGAIEKLAPVFDVDSSTFEGMLLQRATEIRDKGETPSDGSTRISAHPSSRLHKAGPSVRTMSPIAPDSDVLLRHLVATMSRPELFAMLRDFTDAAEQGDAAAFAKARALFDLIPPEVVHAPPESG